jgi:hypothetical protein
MQTKRGWLLFIGIINGMNVSYVKEGNGTFIFARYRQSHISVYAVLSITADKR